VTVNKYGSRKFIVTMVGMSLTALLALLEVMSGEVALVMTAAIGGYHIANAWTTGKGNGNG
jgi:hypothetical protein